MRVMKTIKLRMCIQCRDRDDQRSLIRLQSFSNEISPYTGNGRSFYVCKSCATQEKFYKHMMGKHKVSKSMHETFREQLKEIIANG